MDYNGSMVEATKVQELLARSPEKYGNDLRCMQEYDELLADKEKCSSDVEAARV